MIKFTMDMKETWHHFARRCLVGAYGEGGGEEIADKCIDISPEKTVTKEDQLAEYLEDNDKESLTRLEVFDAMNELRKVKV